MVLNANSLHINDFLAFLIEFSFSIMFLIVFSAIHYTLINKTKLNDKLMKSKTFNFWYFFGFGALLSLFTFLVSQACALAINYSIGLPVIILGFIFAMAFFYNRSVQIGALIPSIFWVLTSYGAFTNGFSWAWCARLIVVLVMATVSIASTYIKWKKWPIFLISLVVVTGACLGVIFGLQDQQLTFHLVELSIAIVSAILFYWTISKINKFLNKMTYMAKSNLYTDEGYVIPSAIEKEFNLFVKNNNLSQALVVTFDIYGNKENILNALIKKFKNNKSILFKTQYDTYGVILTEQQYYVSDIDLCYQSNNKVTRLVPDPLAWLQNEINDLNVYAFVSVYGIHSNDINELIWFNQCAIKYFDKLLSSNIVQFFNSNMLNNQIKDELSYAQLIQKVNLDEITVELEQVMINHNKYICPRFYWAKEFTCDINQILSKFDYETSNTLLRNLAIKSIENYSISNLKPTPLILFYPIQELLNPFFATTQLIKKLKLYGLDKTNIVLSFDCKRIKIWPQVLINNLNELYEYGIKYMFIDLVNHYPLTLVKPEFVIVDESLKENENALNKIMLVAKQHNQNVLLSK